MACTTRRQFVQQTALAAAGLYGHPMKLLGASRQVFGGREQSAAPRDAAVIRKLTFQISGHVITPEALAVVGPFRREWQNPKHWRAPFSVL